MHVPRSWYDVWAPLLSSEKIVVGDDVVIGHVAMPVVLQQQVSYTWYPTC